MGRAKGELRPCNAGLAGLRAAAAAAAAAAPAPADPRHTRRTCRGRLAIAARLPASSLLVGPAAAAAAAQLVTTSTGGVARRRRAAVGRGGARCSSKRHHCSRLLWKRHCSPAQLVGAPKRGPGQQTFDCAKRLRLGRPGAPQTGHFGRTDLQAKKCEQGILPRHWQGGATPASARLARRQRWRQGSAGERSLADVCDVCFRLWVSRRGAHGREFCSVQCTWAAGAG
jgi:hypothetical protein